MMPEARSVLPIPATVRVPKLPYQVACPPARACSFLHFLGAVNIEFIHREAKTYQSSLITHHSSLSTSLYHLPRLALALLRAPRRVPVVRAATALVSLRLQLAPQGVERLEVEAQLEHVLVPAEQ